jgi:hypothetical protein
MFRLFPSMFLLLFVRERITNPLQDSTRTVISKTIAATGRVDDATRILAAHATPRTVILLQQYVM